MEIPENKPENLNKKWALVSLASELGFIIAIPLILLGLAGKWLDAKLHHETKWFALLGILLAIVITTIWLTKKVKSLIK